MKNLYLLCFALCARILSAQSASDAAVQLQATVQASPPQIVISWQPAVNTSQYQVYRKLKGATSWGALVANYNASATQHIDNSVTVGVSYEYRVSRVGTNYSGHGYINAGIEIPETDFRGTMLLLVDSTFATSLSFEVNRLADDMEGDGWRVITQALDRNGSPQHVKSVIQNYYNADPTNTKAVFLLGHLPVPYSGFINPDGHTDHFGAWPADVYYGDMNGTWTDASGPGSSTASPVRTENNPGDGKFDQSTVVDVELQVGRVDLSNMSSFSSNEEQLLKSYLDKDHAYRKKSYSPRRRAVIDDNFGYFSAEAFAASAYKNFSPLLGADSVSAGDYVSSLNAASYLWSYGCGGGSFTSASGVGNTASIASSTLQGTFSMLFGSYFGDWDVPNSFLRAPLASGSVLTNVWSGRPHYQFHHMALGENIGYSFRLTQNFSGTLYFGSPYPITGKWIHNALMGDPSLRHDVVIPAQNIVASRIGNHAIVKWTASPDPGIIGYNLYRRIDTSAFYTRLNAARLTDTSYIDSCLWETGIYKYMVRAVKLEQTPSGSYYNMSEGISDTLINNFSPSVVASFSVIQSANSVTLVNTSQGSGQSTWHLSDGSQSSAQTPTVEYSENGTYPVMLVVKGECDSDTSTQYISVMGLGVGQNKQTQPISAFPNPSSGQVTFVGQPSGQVTVCSMLGEIVYRYYKHSTEVTLDLSHLPKGLYTAFMETDAGVVKFKIQRN